MRNVTGVGFTALLLLAAPASAEVCTRAGSTVTCDDGRAGTFTGDAIVWPDGTTFRARPHPSVILGVKPSIHIGPGVFVGEGAGVRPLDDPNAPHKRNCAILDRVPYCD